MSGIEPDLTVEDELRLVIDGLLRWWPGAQEAHRRHVRPSADPRLPFERSRRDRLLGDVAVGARRDELAFATRVALAADVPLRYVIPPGAAS